jgi:hypothetical protein
MVVGRRPFISGTSFTGVFLGKHLLAAAGNLCTGLGVMGALPGIGPLPYQGLMHYRFIKGHSKNSITDFYGIYDFSADIINWDLHF